jgi:hypothetical protein
MILSAISTGRVRSWRRLFSAALTNQRCEPGWNRSEACSVLVTEGGVQFPANGSDVSPVKQAWVYIGASRGLSSRSAAAGGCPHEQPNAAGHDGEIQVQCERPWPKQVVERHKPPPFGVVLGPLSVCRPWYPIIILE